MRLLLGFTFLGSKPPWVVNRLVQTEYGVKVIFWVGGVVVGGSAATGSPYLETHPHQTAAYCHDLQAHRVTVCAPL